MKAEIAFLAFITLIGTCLAAVPPLDSALAGDTLPPCTSKAFYFDIVGSKNVPYLFVVQMEPATKATWTLYLSRDNPETSFGYNASCAVDKAVLASSNFPNSLIIEKSCGDVEGRWYVVVESDSATTAQFSFQSVQSKGVQFID